MREEDVEKHIKVVIVGNGAVGKSSMIQRYCKGIFTKDYKKTIGVDFLERQIEVNGEDVRLMLWDTAGQEEFDAITKAYYRGAQCCVIAFSTVDRDSFDDVKKWIKKVEDEVGEVSMVLVQNKIDLIQEAVVTEEEVNNLVDELKFKFFMTSVKDNIKVDDVFTYLSEEYLKRIHVQEVEEEQIAITKLTTSDLFKKANEHSKKYGRKKDKETIKLGGIKRNSIKEKLTGQKCLIL